MARLVSTFSRLQKIETACLPKDDPAPGEWLKGVGVC